VPPVWYNRDIAGFLGNTYENVWTLSCHSEPLLAAIIGKSLKILPEETTGQWQDMQMIMLVGMLHSLP
jgi:hypothetical protein